MIHVPFASHYNIKIYVICSRITAACFTRQEWRYVVYFHQSLCMIT